MLKRLLTLFFYQLYHRQSWAYDLVAWAVSFGQWNQWGQSILGLLPKGGRVLEFGFGPGHLQQTFAQQYIPAFGLDESWQMATRAARRGSRGRLVRARAQDAPFPSQSFQAILAIFPSPYIFDPQTAAQIARLLTPGGKMVILLAAQPNGPALTDQLVRLIFRLSAESPQPSTDFSPVLALYQHENIAAEIQWLESGPTSLLLLSGVKL